MRCTYPDCPNGVIDADGFCNVCGREAPSGGAALATAAGSATGANVSVSTNTRTGTATNPATGTGTGTGSRTGSTRGRTVRGATGSSTRRRNNLGAGLLDLPAQPSLDPLKAVMTNPVVPASKRVCNAWVKAGELYDPQELRRQGLDRDDQVVCGARLEQDRGYCPRCGHPYSFVPSLKDGDVVAGKYEVKGPIAFGGLGWIYLAYDTDLGRWVVLKGLLNTQDEAQAEVAKAERRFLAAVKHPNIVGIYDSVSRGTEVYIVMEYVGGKTLKTLKAERGGVLPVAEAIAYVVDILPAFVYLHEHGLLYMDFKSDNVMLEEERVVLIDMGAVRRVDATSGDAYFTYGYAAPEVSGPEAQQRGPAPSVVSDLYTIGRTLALLVEDFKAGAGAYQFALPADAAVFQANPALLRFLEKATQANPDLRFQTADEMLAQLRGVLRLIVATSQPVPPADSEVFGSDVLELVGEGTDRLTGQALPTPRPDPLDPAASALASAALERDTQRRLALLTRGRAQFTASAEITLQLAATLVDRGDYDGAADVIKEVEAANPFEWRVAWLRGRAALAQGLSGVARDQFNLVVNDLPGELAPLLALAEAYEQAGNQRAAAELYDMVSRTDPTFTTATFGLGRCRAALGDPAGAVEAYNRVPVSSSRYVQARLATAELLAQAVAANKQPAATYVEQASLALTDVADRADPMQHNRVAAELLLATASALASGHLHPAPTAKVLGEPYQPGALRLGAERHLRLCARVARTYEERVALVDRANAVRPRTWF